MGQAGVGQAGVGQAGVGQAGVGRAGVGQARVGQAGVGQAGVGQAGVGQAGVGQARVGQAGGGALTRGFASFSHGFGCTVTTSAIGAMVVAIPRVAVIRRAYLCSCETQKSLSPPCKCMSAQGATKFAKIALSSMYT